MKKFTEFSDLDERVVSIAQRKKQARRMAILAKSSAFIRKKKRTMMRIRNSAKLLLVAKKQTLMNFRKKLYPNYKDMAIPQKVKADQIIMQRFGACGKGFFLGSFECDGKTYIGAPGFFFCSLASASINFS